MLLGFQVGVGIVPYVLEGPHRFVGCGDSVVDVEVISEVKGYMASEVFEMFDEVDEPIGHFHSVGFLSHVVEYFSLFLAHVGEGFLLDGYFWLVSYSVFVVVSCVVGWRCGLVSWWC